MRLRSKRITGLPHLPDEIFQHILSYAIKPSHTDSINILLVSLKFHTVGLRYLLDEVVLHSIPGLVNFLQIQSTLKADPGAHCVHHTPLELSLHPRFDGDVKKWKDELKSRLKWVRSLTLSSKLFSQSPLTVKFPSTPAVFENILPSLRILDIQHLTPGMSNLLEIIFPANDYPFSSLDRLHCGFTWLPTTVHVLNCPLLKYASELSVPSPWEGISMFSDNVDELEEFILSGDVPEQGINMKVKKMCIDEYCFDGDEASELVCLLRVYPNLIELKWNKTCFHSRSAGEPTFAQGSYMRSFRAMMGAAPKLREIVEWVDDNAKRAAEIYDSEVERGTVVADPISSGNTL